MIFAAAAAAAAKSLQLCPTLCNPIDSSPPGSPVPGILQARTLEWVAISFSNAWKWKVKVKSLSCVWLLATPWTAAYQAPPSMGFSRQEYWSGVPSPSPVRLFIPSLIRTSAALSLSLLPSTLWNLQAPPRLSLFPPFSFLPVTLGVWISPGDTTSSSAFVLGLFLEPPHKVLLANLHSFCSHSVLCKMQTMSLPN